MEHNEDQEKKRAGYCDADARAHLEGLAVDGVVLLAQHLRSWGQRGHPSFSGHDTVNQQTLDKASEGVRESL